MGSKLNTIDNFIDNTIIDPNTLWGAIFYAIIFAILSFLAARVLRMATHHALRRVPGVMVDAAAITYLSQLTQIMIFILAFSFYAHLIPQLRSLGTALLASVSVASIVIGLAAQNTLGNIIAGISLLIYRPYRSGDLLRVQTPDGPETGMVEELTLGYTVLQTYNNRRILIPNSLMTSQVLLNLSMRDPHLLIEIPFTIGYRSSIDRAREILVELAQQHPKVARLENCPVTEHGNYGIKLLLRVWCRSASDGRSFTFDVMEAAKKRFDAEGIEIPYPYTNVIFMNPASNIASISSDA
ncbi:hypothetical protein AWN76_006280 [Rhodothermaceae bacterium RA]|nr:hypothetical protein AWN76_006280 [Rhodothermaceae bacterium RA]